jgi:histidyl-tRNA synthetase
MTYESVRGMRDILPEETPFWMFLEEQVRDIARRFNYREIRLPIVEHTELFSRGIGEATDVVNKEMYTFSDKKGRSLTLRPEATASVARAYLEHGLYVQDPFQKLLYIGPMFRYEKPQKGRYRQHHQFGVEAIGSLDPALDVEVIHLAWTVMAALGLTNLSLRLNSIGCAKDRTLYRKALRDYFCDRIASMCEDCQRRYEENPLRILDCKEEACQPHIRSAPGSVEHLCPTCAEHFEHVRSYLERLSLAYKIDARLVRGLDYYTRTVFELVSKDLGAQNALLGGGRYDDLIEMLGGPSTPGVGFAAGIDRLIIVLQKQASTRVEPKSLDLFFVTLGEEGHAFAVELARSLRQHGVAVDLDYRDRSLRKQLEYANEINACYLLVLGNDELVSGRGRLKEMSSGEELEVELSAESISKTILGR